MLRLLGYIEFLLPVCQKANKQCSYGCCQLGNAEIILFPGEWEGVPETERPHLQIIAERLGWKRATCTKHCFRHGLYKPLDCCFYPLFPAIRENRLMLLKGSKCPSWVFDTPAMRDHAFKVMALLLQIRSGEMGRFLSDTELLENTSYREEYDFRNNMTQMQKVLYPQWEKLITSCK